jgi:hypothetical protein
MATCRKCKANFGCGCQLINGLCAACNAAISKLKDVIKYVNS